MSAAAEVPQEPVSGSTGRDIALQRLRSDIFDGVVVPDQRLIEADLAERFGVTRNSARLALDALVAEGLVERVPNRGARVRSISLHEAVEVMECRGALDGLLSAKAASNATDEERSALTTNLEAMHQAVAQHDLARYSELIQEHHRLVQVAAHHPVATAMAHRLQGQIVRHQFQLSLRPERAQESLRELEAVALAVSGGDVDAAEAAARAHITGVIAALRQERPTARA